MRLSITRQGPTWLAAGLGLLVLTPIGVVLASVFMPTDQEIWQHLADNLLAVLLGNTAFLLVAVCLGSTVLGVGFAWLNAAFDYPGRSFFDWALFLPFAFPTYVMGYVMLELWGLSGPIQTFLRQHAPDLLNFVPDIRSPLGVALVMTMAFYPYVYLLSRTAFRAHGRRSLEVARSLGMRPSTAFFRVVLPMARPWIFGGTLLVAMETLADFGTVSIFNFDTFTTAIYKAWFGFFSLRTAAQLASLLVVLALILIAIEKWVESRKRFYNAVPADRVFQRLGLKGLKAWGALSASASLFILTFLIPSLHLVLASVRHLREESNVAYGSLLWHTLLSGGIATLVICGASLMLAYACRIQGSKWMNGFAACANMGYALPGTILAVGVFLPLAWLDDRLASLSQAWFGFDTGALLTGTVVAMLAAYLVRFLAVAHQGISAALQNIRPHLDEAALSLGRNRWSILRSVHLPLLRSGLLSAALIVAIDVMKEMPITLMTRPFGWDTLAVRVFDLTSEGEYQRAAIPSLLLVLSGLIPVIMLIRFNDKREQTS